MAGMQFSLKRLMIAVACLALMFGALRLAPRGVEQLEPIGYLQTMGILLVVFAAARGLELSLRPPKWIAILIGLVVGIAVIVIVLR